MDMKHCACSGKTLDRLLRPVVLALLRRGETHGYDLVQQLNVSAVFGDPPPDASGVYKALKSMEREGLVFSDWQLGADGPARRRYALTKDGRDCLKRWAETLDAYRKRIDRIVAVVRMEETPATSGRRRCACRRAVPSKSALVEKVKRTRKG